MSLIARSSQQVVVPDALYGARLENTIDLAGTATNILDAGVTKLSDIGTSAYNTITSTSFLSTAGVTLLAGALASKIKRPSLAFPALAATTQVALSIGNLIKAGAVSDSDLKMAEAGTKFDFPIRQNRNFGANLFPRGEVVSDAVRTSQSDTTSQKPIILPNDVSGNYNMRLQFFRYEREDRKQQTLPSVSQIFILPLPLNLVDAISIQFNDINMGPVFGEIRGEVEDIVRKLADLQLVDAASTAYNNLEKMFKSGGAGEAGRVLARRVISGLSSAAGTALDQALGNTPNPHVTVGFNGVNLRTYRFSWRISPNNLEESKDLELFIMRMKNLTLPRKSLNGFLLDYPHLVKVDVKPEPLNKLFNFRRMFVDNFAVNYAPNNTLSFHPDERPSEVEVTLSLREVDILTSQDYEIKTTGSRGQ